MTRRTFLAAALGAALAILPAAARDLSVITRNSDLAKAQETAFFQPFISATGIALNVLQWGGGMDLIRQHIGYNSEWDVVLVSGAELLAGCEDGLFEKLDWGALGGREHFLPFTASDCGVGTAVSSVVLAWDRDKLAATPTWADFWDVARYPGKRGLRRGARTTLEIALLADGVAPNDIYRLLRTDDGVDRAFHKLDQLKPYLVWWEPGTGASQLLSGSEVLLSSAENVPVTLANRAGRHFGVQWNGNLYGVQSWVVAKASPNLSPAMKLLEFVSDPARQANVTDAIPYGPAVKGANELLSPELMAASPSAAANLAAGLQIDEQFWRENGEKLEARFEAWLAHG